MTISVVIPAFNEAAELPGTLAALRAQHLSHEVIVVDAGSTDSTATVAHEAGARIVASPRKQRAAQMNFGASVACGNALLFLHADTRLAPGALRRIESALRQPEVVGGGFDRRYQSRSLFLRATCALAGARTRLCGWFLGDQAIFARRAAFTALGGFHEWDIFEDLDFSRRLARTGRVVTLRPHVISAARRFTARGAVCTTWRDLALTARYLPGREHRLSACAASGLPACSDIESTRQAGCLPAPQAGSLCSDP